MYSPRDYASQILAESSLEKRRALLDRCPAEWRGVVEDHVKSAFAKVAAYRQHQAGRVEQSQQRPEAAPRRDAVHKKGPPPARSAPEVGNRAINSLRAVIGGANA